MQRWIKHAVCPQRTENGGKVNMQTIYRYELQFKNVHVQDSKQRYRGIGGSILIPLRGRVRMDKEG